MKFLLIVFMLNHYSGDMHTIEFNNPQECEHARVAVLQMWVQSQATKAFALCLPRTTP